MLKRALIAGLGVLGLTAAVAAVVLGSPALAAKAICTNCDCKCGRGHSITAGIYCCLCNIKPNTKKQNSRPPMSFKKRSH